MKVTDFSLFVTTPFSHASTYIIDRKWNQDCIYFLPIAPLIVLIFPCVLLFKILVVQIVKVCDRDIPQLFMFAVWQQNKKNMHINDFAAYQRLREHRVTGPATRQSFVLPSSVFIHVIFENLNESRHQITWTM